MLQKANGGPGGGPGGVEKNPMPTPLGGLGVDKGSSSGNASGDDASSNDALTSPRCLSPAAVTSRPGSPQPVTSPEKDRGEALHDKDSEGPQNHTSTSS